MAGGEDGAGCGVGTAWLPLNRPGIGGADIELVKSGVLDGGDGAANDGGGTAALPT